MNQESGSCSDGGLCSICNEICSRSTPTQKESCKFHAFYHLISGIDAVQGHQIENLCEICETKLAEAIEATEEVVIAREKVANELNSLERKVNLAILELETVSGIPKQAGAASLLLNGVQCATFKMRALKDILKTVSIGLQVASFELKINGSSSSSSPEENTPPDSDLRENETPIVPNAECSDVGNGAIPETEHFEEAEDEPEITIGEVFSMKSEPTGEKTEDQMEPSPSVFEDSEPILAGLIKTEAPQIARVLRGRDIYAPSKTPPQIITNPSENLLPRTREVIVEPEVIDLEAEPCTNQSGTKRKRSPEVTPGKKGKTDKTEVVDPSKANAENEENIANALCEAVQCSNLEKIRELISQKDVQELIQKSTLVKAEERMGPSEKISKLIISCVELSLGDDQEKIEKKKEIISCLLKLNKNLLGPVSKEQGSAHSEKKSYRFSPLLCLDAHPDLILFLLDLGADITAQSDVSNNIILDYLEFSTKRIHHEQLQKTLKIFEKVISKVPEKGCQESLRRDLKNKLISFEEYQFLSRVCFLLDEKDPDGYTPLSRMLFYKEIFGMNTTKKMAGWGADLKWKGQMNGESLLHRAVQNGHVVAVEYLQEEVPQLVNARDEDGSTPLDWLVFTRKDAIPLEDCLSIGEKLLQAGGKFAREDENGGNLLHVAATDMFYDHKGLNTQMLSRLGFDVKQKDKFGNTPLHVACEALGDNGPNRLRVIPLGAELTDNGIPVEFPVYLCTIRSLIRCGASITERNGRGETPEGVIDRLTITNGLKKFVKQLLNSG